MAITLDSTKAYSPSSTGNNNNKKTEQVAAGVGGAAGLSASATKMAGKRGLLSREKSLQQMMESVTSTAGQVTGKIEEATTLWGKFKQNTKLFTKDIANKLKALENTKFIGAIVKNPIVRKSTVLFGGALAFFVLVTGVNKAINTTVDAAKDVKDKVNSLKTAA